ARVSSSNFRGAAMADSLPCYIRSLQPVQDGSLGKDRDQALAATHEPTQGPPPAGATPREANRHRLRTPEGRALYKRRGATVEPAIGNLKKIIDRFSRRGLANATSELHLAATAFNLMKIHKAATPA
ncbi:transposase, partial [Nocardia gipuzkoensis]|uniref:transposase n=1 Tax=Nocardia gipuzkoensis TaxID=2749991 RepID=UPI00237D720F